MVSISSCITHWHVTETGRIESKEDSPFTLLRPYDLAAFLKQMNRLERLDTLKEIIASKEISKSSEMLGSKSKWDLAIFLILLGLSVASPKNRPFEKIDFL